MKDALGLSQLLKKGKESFGDTDLYNAVDGKHNEISTLQNEVCKKIVSNLYSSIDDAMRQCKTSVVDLATVKSWFFELGSVDDEEDAIELGVRTLCTEDFALAEKTLHSQSEATITIPLCKDVLAQPAHELICLDAISTRCHLRSVDHSKRVLQLLIFATVFNSCPIIWRALGCVHRACCMVRKHG